jgi:hypothetical protein
MKPRLRIRFGIWGCVSGTYLQDMVAGYGRTPKEAYWEWEQQVKEGR